jgi:isoamylase
VDGFRFDLASILARDESGQPPVPTRRSCGTSSPTRSWPARSSSPRRGTRPAVPGRQLRRGQLEGVERPLPRRRPRFFRGDPGYGGAVADRSPLGQPGPLRPRAARAGAERQLRDLPRRLHAQRPRLVRRKHNEANGEDNRDGANDNRSWNCGVEGPTDDPAVERAAQPPGQEPAPVTLLSLGVPDDPDGRRGAAHPARQQQRLLPGQRASWFDWTLVERHATAAVPIQFTGTHDALYERHLMFDDVVDVRRAGPRERYEAIARSVRDVLSQRWVRTERPTSARTRSASTTSRWSS